MPGAPTKLTDAQNHVATYGYDGGGRLKTFVFNGARTQSYDYNGVDSVTSETHPETGTIAYTYNSENLLSQKAWGGVNSYYSYNVSGQLVMFTGAEQVTYGYDSRGAMQTITGSSGWSRDSISYNAWGSVSSERLIIPGLGAKTLSYEYDGNNNLKKVIYPDGRAAQVSYNGLNMPETLDFYATTQKSIVSNSSYGPNKMITGLTIQGNGTSFSASYYNNGALNTASLMNGSTPLFNASYAYDGAGNILGISSTAPFPSLSATFVYDSLNRLTSANYTSGRVAGFTYDYDEYGNMKTVRENGALVFNQTYDSYNRINGYIYDGRGNLTSTGATNYFWDSQNRLSAITDAYGQYLADYRYDDRGLRLSALLPVPDIEVQGVPTGGSVDFTSSLNTPADKTFTLQNHGHASLILNGLTITGADASQFAVQQQPTSPVTPNGSTTFTLRFLPSSAGNKSATLSIASNDPDENPYTIALKGYCEPQINVPEIESGGTYDFGTVTIGEFMEATFTIQNLGTANLILYGPPIQIMGPGAQYFSLEQQANSPVQANGATTFIIRFAPMSPGVKTASISIENNDLDENPYLITLIGTGQRGPMKISDESAFKITSPNGGETLEAGSIQNITWAGGGSAKVVRIEYSTDNGSTFKTIVGRAANIGTYPWQVPAELSEACLIRISDADGAVTAPLVISYDFNFKISAPKDAVLRTAHFTFRAGLPDRATQTLKLADISFVPGELRGSENLVFNQAVAEVQGFDQFLEAWHHAQIQYDMSNYTGSVWIDGQPILNSVPLNTELRVNASPEVSVQGGLELPVKLWLDDIVIGFRDKSAISQGTEEPAFQTIVKDDFNKYENTLFPGKGGWFTRQDTVESEEQSPPRSVTQNAKGGVQLPAKSPLTSRSAAAFIDDSEYASRSLSFKFEGGDSGVACARKRISLPPRVPFAVSDENFSIANIAKGQGDGLTDRDSGASRVGRKDGKKNPAAPGRGSSSSSRGPGPGPNRQNRTSSNGAASGTRDTVKTFSASPAGGSYYIYSFDGKLLAEYNAYGVCVRDYVYMGNQLIAEYDPPSMQYYYYTSDQINSTRMATDGTGAVVYSAAYDPYGGIQKTWVSTFDPVPKFTGKERDGESGLDYFGARYYDKSQYRFISADPAIDPSMASYEPARWNLYTYCGGNPTGYVDTGGKSYLEYDQALNTLSLYSDANVFLGSWSASNYVDTTYGDYPYPLNTYDRTDDLACPPGESGTPESTYGTYGFMGFGYTGMPLAGLHSGMFGHTDKGGRSGWQYATFGCIRATDEAMRQIRLRDKIERIRYLRVVKSVPQKLPPPRALALSSPIGVPSWDIGGGGGLFPGYYDFDPIDRIIDEWYSRIPDGTVTIVSVTVRPAY